MAKATTKTTKTKSPKTKSATKVPTKKKSAAASRTTADAVLAQAKALAAADVRVPSIPVDRLIGEARALEKVATAQANVLVQVGVEKSLIAALGPRAAALTEAQATLVVARGKVRTKPEIALEKEGVSLRSDMVADGRYALRSDDNAQATLNYIQEGEGLDDLVQDLKDLTAFFTKYERELGRVVSDRTKKRTRASQVAASLEAMVAERRAADAQGGAEKDLRDRYATLLEQAMSEVRAAGVYVFRKQPDVQAKFRSSYTAAKRTKRGKSAPTTTPATSAAATNGQTIPEGSLTTG
ncbi:MAG: hypothetical protein ABI183_15310 [Polyangiaceae bacterium]